MILQITGRNLPIAYAEAWWVVRNVWAEEDSRNGTVLAVPYPTLLRIKCPTERVLFDPVRDANPFFHVMEFVWMMAGSNEVEWLSQFNKRMKEYADNGILRGAYGWRWRDGGDQIASTIDLLRESPSTRQAVVSMWDPVYDNSFARSSDRPCNTHIYFRVVAGYLDMTVCNRSNDMIWGMLGANAVHMTFLHELVALAAGIPIGEYRVFSNNLHVYPAVPNFVELRQTTRVYDFYNIIRPFPLLQSRETYRDLVHDCRELMSGGKAFKTDWMAMVAWPMYQAYLDRKNRDRHIKNIVADDWRLACEQWADRRRNPGKNDDEVATG